MCAVKFRISYLKQIVTNLSKLFLISLIFISRPALAKTDSLHEQLKQIARQTGVGAVSYTLVEKDRVLTVNGIGKYGLKDSRPVTGKSLFRVGSITKTFTALATLYLVEQGKLRLDQTVKSVLPQIPLQNSWSQTPVTLEMLLEHTSGLPGLTRKELNYPSPLSLQQAFKVEPDSKKTLWQPGYHYSYSNAGTGYVGRMIEVLTKENYDSWFEREILAGLGMYDSQLHWSPQLEKNLVTGYDADLTTKIPYWHTLYRPFGGLNTTAADMAKFLLLFTSNKSRPASFISKKSIQRMETPKTTLAAKSGLKLGYGLGIRNDFFKGYRIYGHGGDGDGYLAEFAYNKESGRAYFVVINAFRHDLIEDFTDYLNNWLIESLPKSNQVVFSGEVKKISKTKLQKLAGIYQKSTQRFAFLSTGNVEIREIKLIKNDLYHCMPNNKPKRCIKLLAVSETLFRTKNEPDASMVFVSAPDGNLYFYVDNISFKRVR